MPSCSFWYRLPPWLPGHWSGTGSGGTGGTPTRQTFNRGSGLPGSPRKSGPPSGCYARHSRWQGGLTDAFADAWRNGTCLAPEGRPAPQPCQAAGSGEVRGEQPDLGSRARGSGAGRVVHLRLRRRDGRGGSGGNPAGADGLGHRVCTPRACISLSQLARSIDTQLKGNVVGYVALVGQSQVVSSGPARTAADPPKLAMGPDVVVNVASVGKMFTTIAVLQSLARHHLSIDSRIWPFLPPNWVKGPGVDTITFRELLTHRAGFRLDSGLVFATDDAAREQIKQGVQQLDKQVADYNNIDFTIFRDMLPFMEGARDPGPAARRSRHPLFHQLCSASGIRSGGRQGRHVRASPQCHAHVPAALCRDRTGESGPGGAIGVLRGRLVYDTGQHAPGP